MQAWRRTETVRSPMSPAGLREIDEVGRLEQAARWVLPAAQDFEAAGRAGREVHERLEVGHDLAARDADGEFVDELGAGVHVDIEPGVVGARGAAAFELGAIERHVRLADQLLLVPACRDRRQGRRWRRPATVRPSKVIGSESLSISRSAIACGTSSSSGILDHRDELVAAVAGAEIGRCR